MAHTPTPPTTEELYAAYLSARCPDAGIVATPDSRIEVTVARAIGSMDARTKRDYLLTDRHVADMVARHLVAGAAQNPAPQAEK